MVVGDLRAATARYAALGFRPSDPIAVPAQGVEVVALRAGEGWVELLRPTDPEGAIGRFHARRGDGLHHVAYRVPNLVAALADLAAAGVRLIDPAPRDGLHGWRIAFVHPESCAGVLTELVEVP